MWRRKPKKKKDDVLPLLEAAGIKAPRKIDYKGQLDRVFSKYIRLRDAMPGGFIKCISCGKIMPLQKFDAGHYFSRRHMATRWDELNVHAECSWCNRFNAEHLNFFRENLIKKIGQKEFDLLAYKANTTRHWSDAELKALIDHYKKEVKRLEKEKGIKI